MALATNPIVLVCLAIAALLAMKLWLRRFVWWLFSFDVEVQRILAQKKSSEVRVGKISEQLAPLLDDFPIDLTDKRGTLVFMGAPIDYVHFDPEQGVTFIEVKSGGARLNAVQRSIREHIESGNVFWEEYRISGR